MVRPVVADKLFFLGIEPQHWAHAASYILQANLIAAKVLFHPAEGFRGDFIAANCSGARVEGLLFTQTVGNIAQMTQSAGVMAFQDIGIEVLMAATSDSGDEVAERTAARSPADIVYAWQRPCGVAIARIETIVADYGAFFQVENVADALTAVAIVGKSSDLKDQLGLAVVIDGNLRVGSLPLVFVAEAAAQADYTLGQRGVRNGPPGDIHLMDPLVADVAIAEIPEPVPVIMHQVPVMRLLRSRPKPDVEIQTVGGIRRLAGANTSAAFVAQTAGNQQPSQLTGADHFHHTGPAIAAAALGSVLDDAVVAASHLHRNAAFVDIVAAGFFDVDVLTRLARPDGHQGMPVIRSGDGNGVQVAIFQCLANILDSTRSIAAALIDPANITFEQPAVGVDEVGDLNAVHTGESVHVRAASAMNPGDTDSDYFIGTQHDAGGLGSGNRDGCCRSQSALHKVTAIQFGHG